MKEEPEKWIGPGPRKEINPEWIKWADERIELLNTGLDGRRYKIERLEQELKKEREDHLKTIEQANKNSAKMVLKLEKEREEKNKEIEELKAEHEHIPQCHKCLTVQDLEQDKACDVLIIRTLIKQSKNYRHNFRILQRVNRALEKKVKELEEKYDVATDFIKDDLFPPKSPDHKAKDGDGDG